MPFAGGVILHTNFDGKASLTISNYPIRLFLGLLSIPQHNLCTLQLLGHNLQTAEVALALTPSSNPPQTHPDAMVSAKISLASHAGGERHSLYIEDVNCDQCKPNYVAKLDSTC